MDPGNWATDIEGGARFGYTLLSVIMLSNIMAIVLQALAARLGIASGRDLAQACRDAYSRPTTLALWLLCEVAIAACDLAEVLGAAIALNLLFGIPLLAGVCLTALDVLLVLSAQHLGFRYVEALVVLLIVGIAGCFAVELWLARPDLGAVAGGFLPTTEIARDPRMLYVAVAILGATVMPHNLYLHTALVQTRDFDTTSAGKRRAIRYNTADTLVALGAAFFVNAAILVVAAAVFHAVGRFDVSELQEAHRLLAPLLGAPIASTAFAVALLASGQSSTITGTLAGQIVMEGFLKIRVRPWLRRLVTRLLAIVPAVALIAMSGGKNTVGLLIFSQVVLSMQLSFAIFPLMIFTSNREMMGEFANSRLVKTVGYAICTLIAALNVYLLYQELGAGWMAVIVGAAVAFAIWVRFFYRGE
jgi:manganese transport protein